MEDIVRRVVYSNSNKDLGLMKFEWVKSKRKEEGKRETALFHKKRCRVDFEAKGIKGKSSF